MRSATLAPEQVFRDAVTNTVVMVEFAVMEVVEVEVVEAIA